jgi:hypothetical protein
VLTFNKKSDKLTLQYKCKRILIQVLNNREIKYGKEYTSKMRGGVYSFCALIKKTCSQVTFCLKNKPNFIHFAIVLVIFALRRTAENTKTQTCLCQPITVGLNKNKQPTNQ